ncbi:MAG: glycoside hydrolase family 88 protein [Rikenellaceae bacterium]
MLFILFGVQMGLLSCECRKEPSFVGEALEYCASNLEQSLEQLSPLDYTLSPRTIESGESEWRLLKAGKRMWTSGFWPGLLWYGYEASGDEKFFREARNYTDAIASIAEPPASNHDIGFMVYCSNGNGYRLDAEKREQYKQTLIEGAESLSTLYNPRVGTILSWPGKSGVYGGHNTIIDNMVNLELLFWAAKESGEHSSLFDMAVSHADKTMQYCFRPDYSVYHVVVYDAQSGEMLRAGVHPKNYEDSIWTRGQGWAIYGYTMCYRYTKYPRYMETAQRAADALLERLPENMIPYWDLADPSIPDAPYDSSAAAIVASALVELSEYVGGDKGAHYLAVAESILMELGRNFRSDDSPALLLHATGNRLSGSEVDASIIYADYYYIEALLRLRSLYSTGQAVSN